MRLISLSLHSTLLLGTDKGRYWEIVVKLIFESRSTKVQGFEFVLSLKSVLKKSSMSRVYMYRSFIGCFITLFSTYVCGYVCKHDLLFMLCLFVCLFPCLFCLYFFLSHGILSSGLFAPLFCSIIILYILIF